jgi:hypothetical protein
MAVVPSILTVQKIRAAKITILGAKKFVTLMSQLVELQVDVKQQELMS